MPPAETLLKNIIQWVKEEENIRAALLLGSRARRGHTDQLSDIDLYLFAQDPKDYFRRDEWIHDFGSVWLTQTQKEGESLIQKVVYQDGMMVEFILFPLEALQSMQANLPQYLEPGYKILVDKDKQARKLSKASGKQPTPQRPTSEDFQETIETFWIDAYHFVKYLWRGELWRSKHYDWQLKQHLLKMMGWHALLCRNQSHFSPYQGNHLKEWIDPDTYIDLMTVFGRLYPADSWRALDETIRHFTRMAEEVAEIMDTDPRLELTEKFRTWLMALKSNEQE